ncbi:hypothetical protein JVT61DRAFT_15125 [Boletus reticuloceps]|uniref:Uncharacterized protein n=1 Tax=Boletus reticuloceps TaxID=495285 RepID=A0A8I2YQB7_9AGAM|nr:hypothetical protein JVT61DRAFT_15125 [Boletus reticuloceps]
MWVAHSSIRFSPESGRRPSDPSATICLEVYTSLESQRTLGAGERLGKLTVTVEQLLAHSEKDVPFTFSQKDKDVVSPSSSILVTCTRGWDGGDDQISIIESIHTAEQDAASPRISDILEVVRLEREQMALERELLAAERERERARLDKAREAKVAALEVELARIRAELDKVRQLRMSESKGPRIMVAKQDKASSNQQKGAPMEEHWAEKRRWEERDGQMQELMEMVSRLLDEQAAARQREEEQWQAGGGKAGIEKSWDCLNTLSNEQTGTRQHEETINAVRATANEQVPYNTQGYLDEFSKALATEVRMMLGEVGKLHEERLSIQHELGYLMTMKSKYGPGGEFDPESFCTASSVPHLPIFPPPEDMPPARPSWRPVRRSRKKQEAPPPEPVPEPRQVHSWVTWQPNPALSPTPPSVEPTQLPPDRGSPGLFGHTNRRDDSSPEPVPEPMRGSKVIRRSLTPSPSSSPEPILLVPDRGSPGLFGPRSPRESD